MKIAALALVAIVVLVSLVPFVLAQAKLVPIEPEKVNLRFTCDEASGICSMPVKDLRTLVAYAQKGADCR